MNTASHAIIRYKDGNEWWKTRIKLVEYTRNGETDIEFEEVKKRTIFDLNLTAGEEKQLVIEVILPNANNGGFKHQLLATDK